MKTTFGSGRGLKNRILDLQDGRLFSLGISDRRKSEANRPALMALVHPRRVNVVR
jgi:hypothetical protein